MRYLILFIATAIVINSSRRSKSYIQKLRFTLFSKLSPQGYALYFDLLYSRFSYFRLLNSKEQRVFIGRLRQIRNRKRFVGRGMPLTEEMEIIVSAAIAQLTFGLNEFDLANLQEIHLTPTSFYSRLVGREVKGLTFESGKVILSWKDFEEGYFVPNDKINLALHELAHALSFDYFATKEIEEAFEKWNVIALREIQSMRMNTDSDFLRDYASTNIHEFWACCVECFFEAPSEFKKHIPDLYATMCKTLKQDMSLRKPVYQNILS